VIAVVGWALLGVFCVAAIVLTGIGAMALMRAQRSLAQSSKRRAASVAVLAAEGARLQAALERLGRTSDAADDILRRAKGALDCIREALRTFSFREARAALHGVADSVSALEGLF